MKSYSTQKVYELSTHGIKQHGSFWHSKWLLSIKKRKITDQSSNFIIHSYIHTFTHNLNEMRSPTISLQPFLFVWLPLGSLCESWSLIDLLLLSDHPSKQRCHEVCILTPKVGVWLELNQDKYHSSGIPPCSKPRLWPHFSWTLFDKIYPWSWGELWLRDCILGCLCLLQLLTCPWTVFL